MIRRYPRHVTRVTIHRLLDGMSAEITAVYPTEDRFSVAEWTIIASAIILAHNDGRRVTTHGLANLTGIARSTLRDKLDAWIAKGYVMRDERGNLDIRETLLVTDEVNAAMDRIRDRIIECGEQLKRQRDTGDV